MIAEKLPERCQEEVQGALVSVFGGPPIDGLGTTGRLQAHHQGPHQPRPARSVARVSRQIVDAGNNTKRAEATC